MADSLGDVDWSVSVDSTVNRARQHGTNLPCTAGAPSNYMNLFAEREDHAIGRSRGGLNTKVHALVDGNGRPLVWLVAPSRRSAVHAPDERVEDQSGWSGQASHPPGLSPRRRGLFIPSDPITPARAESGLSCRDHRTRLDAGNDEAPRAADLRLLTKRTTKAATSCDGASTFSSSDGRWQPATTNLHSLTGGVLRAISIWSTALGDTP